MTGNVGDGHVRFWPARPYGRWSLASAVAAVAGQVGYWVAVQAGQDRHVGDSFFDNWLLAGPALLLVVGGLLALMNGVMAMVRESDRSVAVILSTLIGLLVALFLAFAE